MLQSVPLAGRQTRGALAREAAAQQQQDTHGSAGPTPGPGEVRWVLVLGEERGSETAYLAALHNNTLQQHCHLMPIPILACTPAVLCAPQSGKRSKPSMPL